MKSSTTTFIISLLIIVVAVIVGITVGNKPGDYDTFAQCIEDSGAKFYGAFWCPHCLDQKTLFGKSAELLPYIECSLPDRSGQTEECSDLEVQSYPTWEFADGERIERVMTLQELSEKTDCDLDNTMTSISDDSTEQ